MAKIYGLFGAMSGKVADVVMSVRNGQQIVRKYQPVVSNPKTANQYTTRARFKLISQLSAVLSPVIAIRRSGAVSSRNLFSKYNFDASFFDDDYAKINYDAITLTNGVLALPQFSISRDSSSRVISAATPALNGFNYLVAANLIKTADEKLRMTDSKVLTINTSEAQQSITLNTGSVQSHDIIYVYGVRVNNATARSKFGNLTADTAEDFTKLLVSQSLLDSDITLSETLCYLSNPTSQLSSNDSKNKKNTVDVIPNEE